MKYKMHHHTFNTVFAHENKSPKLSSVVNLEGQGNISKLDSQRIFLRHNINIFKTLSMQVYARLNRAKYTYTLIGHICTQNPRSRIRSPICFLYNPGLLKRQSSNKLSLLNISTIINTF